MRSMSDLNLLTRLRFLIEKAEQTVERTSHLGSYRDFFGSLEAVDLFDATVLCAASNRRNAETGG